MFTSPFPKLWHIGTFRKMVGDMLQVGCFPASSVKAVEADQITVIALNGIFRHWRQSWNSSTVLVLSWSASSWWMGSGVSSDSISLRCVVDIQRLTYSALVLAMLFSTGEAVPLQYYGKLFAAATYLIFSQSAWENVRDFIKSVSLYDKLYFLQVKCQK